MSRHFLPVLMSVALVGAYCPLAVEASDLNFKIYPPANASDSGSTAPAAAVPAPATGAQADTDAPPPATAVPAEQSGTGEAASAPSPVENNTAADAAPATASPPAEGTAQTSNATAAEPRTADSAAPMPPHLESETPQAAPTGTAAENSLTRSEMNASAPEAAAPTASTADAAPDGKAATAETAAKPADNQSDSSVDKKQTASSKVLQGYVHVVPTGTKIPIIIDTAVDSDTSQEGDEFEARTAEDLSIDGQVAVPAGSVIKGRIATLNSPKHMLKGGSVALKFDTVTTPDNRQIPLVATLVARGGVVHARRGAKDILIDTGTFAAPTALGVAIGAIAGHSTSSLGVAGGALIGVGVGAAVGVAILLAKKGKKIDVRPGDELKIELAEELRMPMM